MIWALGESGAPEPLQFCKPLLILSAFIELVAITLIALAIVPADDSRLRPPRGFIAVTRVFNGFWTLVRKLIE